MFFMWLLAFVFAFAVSAVLFYLFRRGTDGSIHNKRKIALRVAMSSICAVLAIVSFSFLVLTDNLAVKIGEPKEIASQTDVIFLTEVDRGGSNGYLSEDNGRYLYFYRDANNEIQADYADIERSKKLPGSLNGEACVLIKTTAYEYQTRWLFFTGNETVFVKTYEFYIP